MPSQPTTNPAAHVKRNAQSHAGAFSHADLLIVDPAQCNGMKLLAPDACLTHKAMRSFGEMLNAVILKIETMRPCVANHILSNKINEPAFGAMPAFSSPISASLNFLNQFENHLKNYRHRFFSKNLKFATQNQ